MWVCLFNRFLVLKGEFRKAENGRGKNTQQKAEITQPKKRGLPIVICLEEIFVKCSQIPEQSWKVELSWSEHRCISKWWGMRRDAKLADIPNERKGTCHSRSWWIAGAVALQIDWLRGEQLAERKQEGDWGNHQVAPVNYDAVHLACCNSLWTKCSFEECLSIKLFAYGLISDFYTG